MQKIAELVSNGLSVTAIICCLAVVALWFQASKQVITGSLGSNNKPLKTEDWFIIGVFLGFLGEALDSAYWLIPWSLSYLGDPATKEWMENGVYFNLFSRQFLGLVSAYCHIRSALCYHSIKDGRANSVLFYASLAGVAYSALLLKVD